MHACLIGTFMGGVRYCEIDRLLLMAGCLCIGRRSLMELFRSPTGETGCFCLTSDNNISIVLPCIDLRTTWANGYLVS